MTKPFNIHDWQAKQRLAENDEYQKRQDRLTPGKNPDEFYGKDSVFTKLKDDPNFIKKVNDKNVKKEHHDDEDFPGKDLSAWDLLDKIKSSNEDLYNKVEAFMKSMNEMNTTGMGTSISTGNSPAYATPFAFKKKKKK